MIGRRVHADADGFFRGALAPGDYVLITPPARLSDGSENPPAWRAPYWIVKSPNGHSGNLANHTITVHEDGTITASPSILISWQRDGVNEELWHGYLERGVWRTV
jgi:hypothetical protein